MSQFQVAFAGFQILGQHGHAAHQIFAILAERLAEQLGIGRDEIRWRRRAGDLAHVKMRLVAGMVIDAARSCHHIGRPVGGQLVGLGDEIMHWAFAPFLVGKALVARVGRGDRFGLLAGHPPQGVRP